LNGNTGPHAIWNALKNMDVKKEIEQARMAMNSGKITARDNAIRKLQYLKTMDRLDMHPSDWFMTRVPVLPPIYRPVSVMSGSGNQLVSDPNYLYKEVIDANNALKELHGQVDDVSQERLNLYNAFKGVVGLGDPIQPKNQDRKVKGILKHVFGSSPKLGQIQRQLLGATVDVVGRAVIAPNPNFDMDQVGIPETKAWNVYQPFIIRRLVQRGVSRLEAVQAVKERKEMAKQAMLEEMEHRPVVISRAPVLHRYGIQAFWPKLVKGDMMQISPIVTKGFGADFNGDSCLTPLLIARVMDRMFTGSFEEFLKTFILYDYEENQAVETLGIQTTVLEIAPEANIRVPAVTANGNTGWYPVSAISIHTSHGPDCYRVKTERGMDAIFTAHHNFVLVNAECVLAPTKTEAVKVGSLIPVVFGLDTYIGESRPPLMPELAQDFDTGVWLGHYLADGAITGRGETVSHASTDPMLLEYLRDVATRFTQYRGWIEGNGNSVRWCDLNLVKTLDAWCGRGCEKKRVPSWIFAAPRECRIGCVAGYLLGEGNQQRGNARVECVNRPLLLDMQALLNTLGVKSSISFGKKAHDNNQETWVLHINNNGLIDLNIPWPDCKKAEQFKVSKAAKPRATHDPVPFPREMSSFCLDRGRALQGNGGKALRDSLQRTRKPPTCKDVKAAAERGYCTRAMAMQMIDGYGLTAMDETYVHNWIELVKNENLAWDCVTSVEKVERPPVTYDLTVNGPETFTIDGFFVSHNTMNFHVPADEQARKDAIEKMLPSRNLFAVQDFKAHYLPQQEYIAGLYHASTAKDEKVLRPRVFATAKDAHSAHERGEISEHTPIEIVHHERTQ